MTTGIKNKSTKPRDINNSVTVGMNTPSFSDSSSSSSSSVNIVNSIGSDGSMTITISKIVAVIVSSVTRPGPTRRGKAKCVDWRKTRKRHTIDNAK